MNNVPQDFYWREYLRLNLDINTVIKNEHDAIAHYSNNGIKENRLYKILPKDFNWQEYLTLNNDLKHIKTERDALIHYYDYGRAECRRYSLIPNDFDWIIYLMLNPDIVSAGIHNENNAKIHYITYGVNEKRKLNLDDININKKTVIILLSHGLGGGISRYVKDLCYNIDTDKYLIITNENIKSNNIVNLESNVILKLLSRCYNNFNIILHINIFTNVYYKYDLMNIYKKLIKLNYSKLFITIHDYYWLNQKTPNLTIDDLKNLKLNITDKKYLSKIFFLGKIIFPSYNVLFNYLNKGLIVNKSNIYITDHIDYKSSINPYYYYKKDEIFKICYIGGLCYEKGYNFLLDVIKIIDELNIKNIEFTFLGYGEKILINTKNVLINYLKEYKEEELPNIINTLKPNLFILPSFYIETWSYVATHMLNTGLPIIYNEHTYNRINKIKRENLYKLNLTLNKKEVSNNILNIIDKIKINGSPIFYRYCYNGFNIPTLYNEIYSKSLDYTVKNLIIITSKIEVSKQPLSYSKCRSIYTRDERFKQLIETINSVKKYIYNSFIIVVDNSKLEDCEIDKLSSIINILLNPDECKLLERNCDCQPFKQLAELHQIKYILNYVKSNNIKFDNLFKITGRYIINNDFVYDKYINDKNIFKKIPNLINEFYTCFYKIHYKYFDDYNNNINNLINKCNDYDFAKLSLEYTLPKDLPKDSIDILGITQRLSCWKDDSKI